MNVLFVSLHLEVLVPFDQFAFDSLLFEIELRCPFLILEKNNKSVVSN